MEDYEVILNALMAHLNPADMPQDNTIPVGISNRHIHLSQTAVDKLFGCNYQLTKLKDLSQPGQYACKECLMICGPKGVIEKVRILGPVRPETQVEILQSDTFKLGIKGALRLSGDLTGTPGVTLIGPKGSFEITQGVIVAKRHIHMLPEEAVRFGVTDGEAVTIEFDGERGGSLANVIVRAKENSGLECHIDTEEANALGVTSGTKIKIKK
ncbi:phosphate propanoyltransferase [Enterococcus dongliensis]|uniref:Phosphate propanoyltransferase n=1 Tax=Enterococcus dongliensis TaxID=2559925 RepID=A0AAP5U1K0_9ENTE|nr:phosphate propanoyltransferase [Enterococcus dongliensis]MDT2597552.1 phosphate propanoyltransferase [Enterococcus dongliensis]MDT2635339.1 phosphate propanoyltransferase [Enterococcus dongliensis]MDT2638275.1 phosphate propanoyltransferase [Enterococcus dongliensis]MDT2640322.1 phosphate propanoyltransferase [Enterococcus dongliensis]MDT2643786.1 phosphate propanoyltransferase [Enterococcus dongliensis]